MQRQIINGIPYYIDSSNKIYTFTEEPAHIGQFTEGILTINPSSYESLDRKLKDWRESQSARTRKPTEAKKDS
jgi:hypothetical protein